MVPERWSGVIETEGNLGRTDLMLETSVLWRFAPAWTVSLGARVMMFTAPPGWDLLRKPYTRAELGRAMARADIHVRQHRIADGKPPAEPEQSVTFTRADDDALVGRFELHDAAATEFETAIETATTYEGDAETRSTAQRQADALHDICAFYNKNHDSDGTPRHRPHVTINADAARADAGSVFHHYRRLIGLRHDHEVVREGRFELLLPDHEQIFAYTRTLGDQVLVTVANMSSHEVRLQPGDVPDVTGAEVLIATHEQPTVDVLRPWESAVYLVGS